MIVLSGADNQFVSERSELEAVLQSGIFSRAPNLASFLKYVCRRHFEGQSDTIKEYSIAVEALGRSADFDQKKDAIVRVEAHRLRRRLMEYYSSGPGAEHDVQIEIPSGQYAPKFVVRPKQPQEAPERSAAVIEFVPQQVQNRQESSRVDLTPDPRGQRTALWWVILALAGCAVFGAFLTFRYSKQRDQPEVWNGNLTDPVPSEFRFLAGYGGQPIVDRQGRIWQPDSYYSGGASSKLPLGRFYEGVPDPKLIQGRREGNFRYDIPVRPGVYEVRLYFLETNDGDPNEVLVGRLFRVYLNNGPVPTAFEPAALAGAANRLFVRVFRDVAPAKDGKIHLRFESQTGKSLLNAVEVLSSNPGQVRPVRIVAARQSVTDPNGLVWAADEYAVGGVLVERKDSIRDPALKMLFTGEHFGNFSYHIPVAPGRYRLKLYFAETYFGSKLPYANDAAAISARIFDVYTGGQALLRNFDIVKEAGGPNLAVIKTFDNIEPDAQGQIVLEFVPVRNWPEVNAIEVTQMP